MNTLTSYTINSPFDKEETCAKFSIDNIESPFVLNSITTVGQNYVFSCWIKSDSDGNMSVENNSYKCSAEEWTRVSVKFTASSENLPITFGIIGTYYVYRAQLEIGTIPTDWSPAPEDVNQSIADSSDEIREVISEQTTSTMNTIDEKMENALESYVDLSEYGEFKENIAAQMAVLENEIAMTFPALSDKIDNVDNDLQSKFIDMYKYITFSQDGITISASDENAMSIRIDNDVIKFEKNGNTFGWWDGINFHTGNITVNLNERAQFGNFAYVPRSDGSLSFLKVANFAGFYATLNYGTMTIYGADVTAEDATLNIVDVSGELNGTTLVLGG